MIEFGNDGITYEMVVLKQLMMVGDLSSKIYFSPRSDWQTNALNVSYTVDLLESMAWPYLGKKYRDDSKKIEKATELLLELYKLERKESGAAYIRKGQNYEMRLILNKVKVKLRYLQDELDKAKLLRKKVGQAVDDGNPGDPVIENILSDIGR